MAVVTAITCPVVVAALEPSSQTPAQPVVNGPAFEVASIRVHRDGSDPPTLLRPILQPGGRVLMRGQTLRDLILAAYGVRENELIGGPDWVRSIAFDLEARGAADMSPDTARAMLRTLLAQRFSLVVHREQRELPIYVLTTARNGQTGPRLRPADAQCAPVTPPKGSPPGPLPPHPKGVVEAAPLFVHGPPPRCGSLFLAGHFSGRSVTMEVLTGELAAATGRAVVNRTGLTGEFDFDLRYAADLNTLADLDAVTTPELTTAVQEQLGLRLQASRGPVEVLVVDQVMMPTEN
jgi:uncharacterized protein (TIGR03435 family)